MDCTLEAFLGAARLMSAHGTATLRTDHASPSGRRVVYAVRPVRAGESSENDGAFLAGLHLERAPTLRLHRRARRTSATSSRRDASITKKFWKRPTAAYLRWSVAPELEGAMELCG